MSETTNVSQSIFTRASRSRETLSGRRDKGFTMAEIMVVIVVMGVLALIAVPIYNNVRGAAFDAVKAKNATTLNQLMTTCHNAGVDMSTWVTSKAAIDALTIGVNLPTSIASATTAQQIKLQEVLNPDAYKFTLGDATKAPSFTPNLDGATTKP